MPSCIVFERDFSWLQSKMILGRFFNFLLLDVHSYLDKHKDWEFHTLYYTKVYCVGLRHCSVFTCTVFLLFTSTVLGFSVGLGWMDCTLPLQKFRNFQRGLDSSSSLLALAQYFLLSVNKLIAESYHLPPEASRPIQTSFFSSLLSFWSLSLS